MNGGWSARWLALWAASALVAFALPMLADEAYYLDWSRHPAFGYFDHPPGVALWVAAGLGHPRLPGVLLFPLTAWLLVRAAAAWGVVEPGRAPVLVLGTPIGLAGTCLATPDAPLLPLMAALLWAAGRRRFFAVGVLLGLSLWVKSTPLLLVPGLLLVSRRRALEVLAPALVVLAPHLGWSLAHEGLPYTFQAGRLGQGVHLPEFLAGQLGVVTPLLALVTARALWRAAAPTAAAQDRALSLLAGTQLVAWFGLSFFTRVEANWPAFAWLPALLLLGRHPSAGHARAQNWAFGLTLAAAGGLVAAARFVPPSLGPPRDPEALSACLPPESQPVARRYQERALLAAAGREVPYLRSAGGRASQYDRWSGPVTPTCGFTYLGPSESLAGRCAGDIAPLEICGRPATRCRCPGDLAP